MNDTQSQELVQILREGLTNGKGAEAGTISSHGENISCGLHAVATSINHLADSQNKLALAMVQLAGSGS